MGGGVVMRDPWTEALEATNPDCRCAELDCSRCYLSRRDVETTLRVFRDAIAKTLERHAEAHEKSTTDRGSDVAVAYEEAAAWVRSLGETGDQE